MENEKDRNSGPKMDPEAPASARQKLLLKRAIQRDWLHPNPFGAGQYGKWQALTAGEADRLLSSITPERLGVLEKEMEGNRKFRSAQPLAEKLGREAEEFVREIGRQIDGGF